MTGRIMTGEMELSATSGISLRRRDVLLGAGALGLSALAAPAIAQPQTLTISTWAGGIQDVIKAHVLPEFAKRTGAGLAYDIGGQGARYNKLLVQRASPSADVFLSSDEAVVAGHRAGVLMPASRKSLANLAQVHDWALSVKEANPEGMIAGVPFTLITYLLGYNPDAVKQKPTSWADLWRPEFSGKLSFASPVHSQMPALVILAAELAGGSAADIDPGFRKLAELRPAKLSVAYTDWASLNKTGEVILSTEFDYYLDTMKDQGYAIDYVAPKEGGIACLDYVSIVRGTKSQEIAEVFLDLMISPAVQEALAVETYQGPISKAVTLGAAAQARCACGARVDHLRFFDPAQFVADRPAWTERLNTDVVPNWHAR
jgi:putative spermidine/putrescine transport system substrate-binding protein